ncbi:MAG: hypothetical protein O7H39_05840 [Gammaproteobacteria bacterium]|nr:hypothetical protein [Gammaproteobacteria bacterium]
MNDRDEKFIQDAGRVLLDAEHDIDPRVLERLQAMRREAVQHADRSAPQPLGVWVPTSAVVATILTVGIALSSIESPTAPMFHDEHEQLAVQDMELLEDLEFLAWLDSEAELGNAG